MGNSSGEYSFDNDQAFGPKHPTGWTTATVLEVVYGGIPGEPGAWIAYDVQTDVYDEDDNQFDTVRYFLSGGATPMSKVNLFRRAAMGRDLTQQEWGSFPDPSVLIGKRLALQIGYKANKPDFPAILSVAMLKAFEANFDRLPICEGTFARGF